MYSGNEFHTKSETFDLPTEEPNYGFDFEELERKRRQKRKNDYIKQVRTQVPDPPYTSEDYSQLFTTDQTFKDLSEAFDWVQRIGMDHKMEMEKVYVVRPSRAKGLLGIVRFCCERHKSYRAVPGTEDEHGRRKVMKNLECQFAIKCYQVDPDSWALEVACGVHNHELGRDTLRERYELERAGAAAPAQRKRKRVASQHIRKPLYGFECRKAVQQFRNQLVEFNYFERHRVSKNADVLSELLFAHPKSLDLLRAFPYVLILGLTYKTDRHDMPFFEVMGITSELKKFNVASALMSEETEDNYLWVLNQVQEMFDLVRKRPTTILALSNMSNLALLNAIDTVFPHTNRILNRCLLYSKVKNRFLTWSVKTALFSRCRSVFEADTEDSYNTEMAFFESEWNGSYSNLVEYVDLTWLNSYKEWIVSVWTDRVTHFGSNNIEVDGYRRGRDSLFQGLLRYFEGGFSTLFNHLHSELELQIGAIKESLAVGRTWTRNIASNIECFRMLLDCVSFKAFEILVEEYRYATRDGKLGSCNCVLKTTHGLPCAHVIAKYVEEGRLIEPAMIHDFWRTLDFGDATHVADRNRYSNDTSVADSMNEPMRPQTNSTNGTMHPQSASMEEPSLVTSKD